jgi:hypothetical protein
MEDVFICVHLRHLRMVLRESRYTEMLLQLMIAALGDYPHRVPDRAAPVVQSRFEGHVELRLLKLLDGSGIRKES